MIKVGEGIRKDDRDRRWDSPGEHGIGVPSREDCWEICDEKEA